MVIQDFLAVDNSSWRMPYVSFNTVTHLCQLHGTSPFLTKILMMVTNYTGVSSKQNPYLTLEDIPQQEGTVFNILCRFMTSETEPHVYSIYDAILKSIDSYEHIGCVLTVEVS